MKNTSGLTRKQRKEKRALRKALWKRELPSYYFIYHTVSKAGIQYVNIGHL